MGVSEGDLFEEELLYEQAEPQTASSEDEAEDPPAPAYSKQKPGLDVGGGASRSASHQSSTLRASLDEELPTPSPPVDVPGGIGMAARRAGSIQPMQRSQQQHYPRLGTSAPIAIPAMMGRWRSDAADGRPGEAASTFIPPHQLSKQDDFMFSLTGASPSATLKRERLRARNAILRSTGFLEPQAGAGGAGGAPASGIAIPGLEGSQAPGLSVARTPVQSTLTAALTTIGEA